MYPVLHLGFGHPNLIWFVVTAIIAFAVGFVIATYRSFTADESDETFELTEEAE